MQFVITAYDGAGMLEKRMSIRQRHLDNIMKVKEYGSVICAGGILDDERHPIGSALVMDFATRDLLDKYLESEPYIIEGIWQNIKIEPMNVVILEDEFVK